MNGVINVLKPPGLTSSDVVSDVRKILNIKRAGHTGTLDPYAAGVLPVCIGASTRLFDYLVDKQKTYIAEITFGFATDTQDSSGAVIKRADCNITARDISNILPEFKGSICQVIPVYSAVQHKGQRLYKLARSGEAVEPKTKNVEIYDIRLIAKTCANRFLLEVICSKGTYIRTLCNDIGERLNAPAYMSFLLRTKSGDFDIADSFTLEELRRLFELGRLDEAVIPADKALKHMPAVHLNNSDARTIKLISNGAEVDVTGIVQIETYGSDALRVYCGGFIGIGRIKDSRLRIVTNLTEAQNGSDK